VPSAAIFVFVGVDCNRFRYVLDLLVEVRSDQLVTVPSAAIFVFVGVGSNLFRYVLDFDVTVQGLVGDLPGGTADHSDHF